MISRKTVLILGAGASKPYLFPTGRELLLEICEKIEKSERPFVSVLSEIGISQERLGAFRFDLARSNQPSVDAFVENRPEYLDVGKATIAAALIPYERPEMTFERRKEVEWYEYLFHQLGPKPEDMANGNLTIVTFNYDRSLDYFLFMAAIHSFGVDSGASVGRSIPIVHLYGLLGEPVFKVPETGRQYDPQLDAAALNTSVAGILMPQEAEKKADLFHVARKLIRQAEVVCFLGCAYHPLNIQRLDLPTESSPIIHGSTHGLKSAERERAKNLFPQPGAVRLDAFGFKALDFLREYPVFG